MQVVFLWYNLRSRSDLHSLAKYAVSIICQQIRGVPSGKWLFWCVGVRSSVRERTPWAKLAWLPWFLVLCTIWNIHKTPEKHQRIERKALTISYTQPASPVSSHSIAIATQQRGNAVTGMKHFGSADGADVQAQPFWQPSIISRPYLPVSTTVKRSSLNRHGDLLHTNKQNVSSYSVLLQHFHIKDFLWTSPSLFSTGSNRFRP